jgi:4-hydroxybenzoate polyprenyltransferase
MIKKLKNLLKLLRVKQWIKNSFVGAALIFSGKFTDMHSISSVLISLVLFCLISSSVYILNDILDVNEDKFHPQKRLRPIASGEISVRSAAIMLFIILLAVFTASFTLHRTLFSILAFYFILNMIYCFKLKHIIIVDVMTIAAGFILRVAAGAVVIDVVVSEWLFLCTGLLSLYLGFSKRKNELIVMKSDGPNYRKILSSYGIDYLNRITLILMALIIETYILYVVLGTDHKMMIYTIPFVIYGTFKYEYLVNNYYKGGIPEDAFTEDIPFLINILLWILTSFIAIYVK